MKRNAKEIVADRLDGLMKAVPHLGTQQALAKKTGIGQTTIGRIRRGEVNATAENIKAIADAFGVAVGYLYGEETPNGVPLSVEREIMDKYIRDVEAGVVEPPPGYYNALDVQTKGKLPLISWVQAGAWTQIVDNFHPGDAEEWIPCPFNHGPNAFILRVVGTSMYNPGGDKSFAEGDYIAVDPAREARNKSLVVIRENGDQTATFKQLLIEPDGTYLLQALNPNWPRRIQPMPENSDIVGVVIGKWVPE